MSNVGVEGLHLPSPFPWMNAWEFSNGLIIKKLMLLCLCKFSFFQDHSQFTEVSAGKNSIFHFLHFLVLEIEFPWQVSGDAPKILYAMRNIQLTQCINPFT